MLRSSTGFADHYLVWIVGFYAALQTCFQAFISFRHGEIGDGVTWAIGSVTIFVVAFFLETVKDRRTP